LKPDIVGTGVVFPLVKFPQTLAMKAPPYSNVLSVTSWVNVPSVLPKGIELVTGLNAVPPGQAAPVWTAIPNGVHSDHPMRFDTDTAVVVWGAYQRKFMLQPWLVKYPALLRSCARDM
jgi:hypothetical protein